MLAKFGLSEMIVTENGMGIVSQKQWHQAHYLSSVPPSLEWTSRKGRTNCQERPEEGEIGIHEHTSSQASLHRSSPAELLLGRRPHTRLDLLRPNTAGRVEERQQQQKQQHDSRAKVRVFKAGETVLVKNYGSGCRWLPGRIMEASGPV